MKNKILSVIFAVLSIFMTGYFILLQIDSPSPPSFVYLWLVGGIFCAFILYGIRKDKLHPSRKCKITVCIVLTTAAIIAVVNLYRIETPAVSSGKEQVQYLVVLGGGLKQDDTLGTVPLNRLFSAAEYLKSHPQTKAVVSGGEGRFMPSAEAPVLARELEKLGIAKNRILQEDKALDTIQNFSYSAELMAKDSGTDLKTTLERPVAVVTSRFHLARAERIARREGYKTVYGVAAKIPAFYILNSYGREICSYIKLDLRILFTGEPCALYNH